MRLTDERIAEIQRDYDERYPVDLNEIARDVDGLVAVEDMNDDIGDLLMDRTALLAEVTQLREDILDARMDAEGRRHQADDTQGEVERLTAENATLAARHDVSHLLGQVETLEGEVGRLRKVAIHARCVMDLLQQYGPGIVGHLLDTDDNQGQYLRDALAAVRP